MTVLQEETGVGLEMLLVEAEMVTFLQGYDSRHEQFKDWTVWRGHGRAGPESATGWAAGTVEQSGRSKTSKDQRLCAVQQAMVHPHYRMCLQTELSAIRVTKPGLKITPARVSG